MSDFLLQAQGIAKSYAQGGGELSVLQNIDLRLQAGEIVALVGPSGSGKSTLLHILGLLDTPTTGHLTLDGQSADRLNDQARTKLRRSHIGFIYQFHHLLPEFSALENVMMPQIIASTPKGQAQEKAETLLSGLGLAQRMDHRPARLSGGEQQRVAIARALANEPKILLADEPTGNLDPDTAEDVFDLLLTQSRERGIGALIATHNMDLADRMDRVLELKAGRIVPF